MLTLTIDAKKYKAPHTWDEITLAQYMKLCSMVIPPKLRDLWAASISDDDKAYKQASDVIGIVELEKHFPKYYGRVLRELTNIPPTVIDRMYGGLREEFFNKYLRHFVISAFTMTPMQLNTEGKLQPYTAKGITSFKIDATEYHLPTSLKLYGSTVPMAKESVVTFAEASDIEVAVRQLADGGADRIPMFIAVYCRPAGKPYNEEEALQRADLFRALTMDNVWEVFFCISKQLHTLQDYTLQFSKAVAQQIGAKYSEADLEILAGAEQSTK